MSKLFKISGNMMMDGKWLEPDPEFAGEIVVDEAGKFCGWCEKLADKKREDIAKANWQFYLVGTMADENHGYSLQFLELSNVPWRPAVLFEIHTTSGADSIWSAKDPGGGFVPYGNARVDLEELEYSEEHADRVKRRFRAVDININHNGELIQIAHGWRKRTLVLWS